MKKLFNTLAALLMVSAPMSAQTVYDLVGAVPKDISGTARYVGMGGAMNALGGDISTISLNPAGIGVFRSSDISATGGLSVYHSTDKTLNGTHKKSNTRGDFDQIGFVYSSKTGNSSSLRYLNLGFNYHRANDFYRINRFSGDLGDYSQTFQMASQAGGITSWGNAPFNDDEIGWLSALGYESYLLMPTDDEGHYYGMYTDGFGDLMTKESGGLDVYDFNVSANLNDRLYLGFTIGAYDLHYSKYYIYNEDYTGAATGQGYSLESWNRLRGMGVNFKFGGIWRPIEDSPFRLGFAIHTPTFYELSYRTGAYIGSQVEDFDGVIKEYSIDTWNELGNRDMERHFQYQSPWLFNVSAATTVGGKFAIDAEYQYEDYSAMKFRDVDGYSGTFAFENSTRGMLKGVSQARVGVEFKPISQLAVRAGYNYQSGIFNKDAYKDLPYYAIQTDTDFQNTFHTNTYTVGLGYRGNSFYADLAYKYSTYKSDLYPFVNTVDGTVYSPDATKCKNSRGQLMLTLGFRL